MQCLQYGPCKKERKSQRIQSDYSKQKKTPELQEWELKDIYAAAVHE